MPHSAIQLYMEKLHKRQAELRLILGEAATVPHMDADGRNSWSREIDEVLHGEGLIHRDIKPSKIIFVG